MEVDKEKTVNITKEKSINIDKKKPKYNNLIGYILFL